MGQLQQAVTQDLTARLGRAPTQPELDEAMRQATAAVVAGPGVSSGGLTVAPGSLAAALGPGATGQEDLQTAFRLALAGQRNLADLALAGTGRELATDIEQAPMERQIRLGSLGGVPGLLAPTGNLAPALATGQNISRNITDLLRPIPMRLDPTTGTFVPDFSSPNLPSVLQDPVRAALEQETLRVLAGEVPTPELEQAEREETAALHNRLFRQLGPGYELSTTGSQLLNQLRDSQQIRRNQYRLQTVGSLAPQELERRRFGESATQGRLQTLLPAELQRAEFGENVRGLGLRERVALTDLGRRPVSQLSTTLGPLAPVGPLLGLGDAEADRRFQQELQTKVALSSFDAEQRERAARAQSIAGLFGTAGRHGLRAADHLTVPEERLMALIAPAPIGGAISVFTDAFRRAQALRAQQERQAQLGALTQLQIGREQEAAREAERARTVIPQILAAPPQPVVMVPAQAPSVVTLGGEVGTPDERIASLPGRSAIVEPALTPSMLARQPDIGPEGVAAALTSPAGRAALHLKGVVTDADLELRKRRRQAFETYRAAIDESSRAFLEGDIERGLLAEAKAYRELAQVADDPVAIEAKAQAAVKDFFKARRDTQEREAQGRDMQRIARAHADFSTSPSFETHAKLLEAVMGAESDAGRRKALELAGHQHGEEIFGHMAQIARTGPPAVARKGLPPTQRLWLAGLGLDA